MKAAPSLRQAAVSALRWNALAAMTGLGAQVLQLAWVARSLSPHDFGAMGVASLFLWFGFALADLGLGTALVQAKSIERSTQTAAYAATLAGSMLAAGLLALGGHLFASPPVAGLVLGLMPCFPLQALTVVAQAGLQRELRFRDLGLADAAAAAAGLGAAALGVLAFGDARALVAAQVANAATRCALSLWKTPWRLSADWPKPGWTALSPLYPFGAYQMAERVVNYFVGHLDKMVVNRFLGSAALGHYSIAYQLAMRPLSLLTPMVQRTTGPLFSRMQGETYRLAEAFALSTRLLAHATAPLHLLGAALATPVLRLLLGPQWAGAVPIFQALCLWSFFITTGQTAGALLPAVGRADASLKLNLAAVAAYALFAYLGTALGPAGVAWGLVAATALVLVPYDAYLRWRTTGIGLAVWLRAVGPALAISSLSGWVAATLARFVAPQPFASLTVADAAQGLAAGLAAGLVVEAALQAGLNRRLYAEARALFFARREATL